MMGRSAFALSLRFVFREYIESTDTVAYFDISTMATVNPVAGAGPAGPVHVNIGPWANVSHRCVCRTKSGERCKRKTRHLSRWCWQHRAPLTDDEVDELVRNRPYRCTMYTKAGRQCSRDAKMRYVVPYCKQHFRIAKLAADDDSPTDSEDEL